MAKPVHHSTDPEEHSAKRAGKTETAAHDPVEPSRAKGASSSTTDETAQRVHQDIEDSLHSRTAPPGTSRAALEDTFKSAGESAWKFFKRHPFLGVASAGAVGLSAAAMVGVGEIAIGMAVAFTAFKVLRQGEPPLRAVEELEQAIH